MRKWPEINQRVLYPIKAIPADLENQLEINMYDPVTQFCVSFVTMNVVEIGIQRVVGAWSSHPLNGKPVF